MVDEDGTINVETLWAYALGEDRPTFQRVLEKSGNRTVRVILDPPLATGNSAAQAIQELLTMGCSYEGANPAI